VDRERRSQVTAGSKFNEGEGKKLWIVDHKEVMEGKKQMKHFEQQMYGGAYSLYRIFSRRSEKIWITVKKFKYEF
jgi:hypothetical protein